MFSSSLDLRDNCDAQSGILVYSTRPYTDNAQRWIFSSVRSRYADTIFMTLACQAVRASIEAPSEHTQRCLDLGDDVGESAGYPFVV